LTQINLYPDGIVNTKLNLPNEVCIDKLIKVINLENTIFLVSEVGVFYHSPSECEQVSCHPGIKNVEWVKLHSYIKVGKETFMFVPDQIYVYRGVLYARKECLLFESDYNTYRNNFLAWRQVYWAPEDITDFWVDQYQNYITLHTENNVAVYKAYVEQSTNSVDLKIDCILYEARDKNTLYRWFNDFGDRKLSLDNSIKLVYQDDQLKNIVGPINNIPVAGGQVDVGSDNRVYYHAGVKFLHLFRSRVIPLDTNKVILY
jgi:hypothetical protein